MSDSQQKREAVVEDFRTIRLSNGRNLTEDTPQTAVSPWNYPTTRSCGFSQVISSSLRGSITLGWSDLGLGTHVNYIFERL